MLRRSRGEAGRRWRLEKQRGSHVEPRQRTPWWWRRRRRQCKWRLGALRVATALRRGAAGGACGQRRLGWWWRVCADAGTLPGPSADVSDAPTCSVSRTRVGLAVNVALAGKAVNISPRATYSLPDSTPLWVMSRTGESTRPGLPMVIYICRRLGAKSGCLGAVPQLYAEGLLVAPLVSLVCTDSLVALPPWTGGEPYQALAAVANRRIEAKDEMLDMDKIQPSGE